MKTGTNKKNKTKNDFGDDKTTSECRRFCLGNRQTVMVQKNNDNDENREEEEKN